MNGFYDTHGNVSKKFWLHDGSKFHDSNPCGMPVVIGSRNKTVGYLNILAKATGTSVVSSKLPTPKRYLVLSEAYSSFLLLLSPPELSPAANPLPLEATNSTLPVSFLSASLSFLNLSLAALSSPLNAQSGKAPGSQSSFPTVVPYCSASTPAKASSLSVSAGFRSAGEDSSLELK